MKKNFCLAVFLGMTLWVCMNSCSKEPSEAEAARTPESRVEWEMRMEEAGSRADIQTDGSGHFTEGDTIILYARNLADGSQRRFTLHASGGRWVPEIYWSEIGEEVQFSAWHLAPAIGLHSISQDSPEYLHALAIDQSEGGYERSDLLCAQVRARAGERVQLLFGHALSRLHLVLESRDQSYTQEELQQAVVQIQTAGRLPFSLPEGTMQAPSERVWITPVRRDGTTWTALLAPQQASAMPADEWIRIRIDGRETTLKIPETVDGKPFTGLEAGKELTYRLNLQRAEAEDPFAGAIRWVYGVKEPSDDQWNYDHTQLAWTKGCGWFDCNKLDPSDTSTGGDGLMCWAAATSNLIHWWLEQNRETAAVKSYGGPSAAIADMRHSAIFQLFKNHFSNQGDYPLKGINWFFNGVFHKRLYDTDPVDPNAGFFRQQLGSRSLGAEYLGTEMTRDRFNAIVRQALTSRQGILFVINMGRGWTTHAVTLWGAKFDDEGRIETLYMVDNNDGRSDARGTMRTMEVRYLPYSEANPDLYPYVPNSTGGFTMRIESICTLSLGSEWIQ